MATLLSHLGPLAQLVEQGTLNPKVAGSIPARPMKKGLLCGAFSSALLPVAPRGDRGAS